MVFRMGMGPESPLSWLEPGNSSGGGRALRLMLVILVLLLVAGAGVLAYNLVLR